MFPSRWKLKRREERIKNTRAEGSQIRGEQPEKADQRDRSQRRKHEGNQRLFRKQSRRRGNKERFEAMGSKKSERRQQRGESGL